MNINVGDKVRFRTGQTTWTVRAIDNNWTRISTGYSSRTLPTNNTQELRVVSTAAAAPPGPVVQARDLETGVLLDYDPKTRYFVDDSGNRVKADPEKLDLTPFKEVVLKILSGVPGRITSIHAGTEPLEMKSLFLDTETGVLASIAQIKPSKIKPKGTVFSDRFRFVPTVEVSALGEK